MTHIISGINKFISECWRNIFAEVYNAVVYMDRCAIECLHWYTAGKGYLTLKDAGAVAVYEFGMYDFRYVQVKGAKKAIIISTSEDPIFYQRTLKTILTKNAFESCIVYCGAPCSTTAYYGISQIQKKLNYVNLKRDIRIWMASETISHEPIVNIIYVPVFVAFLNKNLFVTPPFGDLMPPLNKNISEDAFTKVNILAYSFCQLFHSINARLDVYSLGTLSEHFASSLENYMSNIDHRIHLSETPEIAVSVILIDRTLDLGTPTSNNMESFLTKILRTFPRLPHHDNDVAIDISPAFGTVTEVQQAGKISGSLASMEESMMDMFISQKEKHLLGIANQFLSDMPLAKGSPKLRTPARISGHSLQKVISKIQTANCITPFVIQTEKLQCILAIIGASTSQMNGQFDLLISLEKLALQSLSVSRESTSILIQLSSIIRTRNRRGLDIENLLALLIHVYAFAGTQIRFSRQQEDQLQESIADAIFEDYQVSKKDPLMNAKSNYLRTLLLLRANDIAAARETSYRIAVRIIDTLRLVAEQSSTLQDYRFCMLKPNSQKAMRYVSILEQITEAIFCAGISRELRDLQIKPSSNISADFNLILRGKAKRRPRDNPYILIYIVGGITAEEAKITHEVASFHSEEKTPYIILAGSRLLNPMDIVDKLFFY